MYLENTTLETGKYLCTIPMAFSELTIADLINLIKQNTKWNSFSS